MSTTLLLQRLEERGMMPMLVEHVRRFHVTPEELLSATRGPMHVSRARDALFYELYVSAFGWRTPAIGDALGRDPVAVRAGILRHAKRNQLPSPFKREERCI